MIEKKPKLAFYWLAGCGGCEESVIDLSHGLLELAGKADILFWPVALDSRYSHVAALADRELDAVFINGAVRTVFQAKMARLLRAKSKIVVAHGSCAHTGGVLGLANFFTARQVLERSYLTAPTVENPDGIVPGNAPESGELALSPKLLPLDRVVRVDAIVPGCPPTPEMMRQAIEMAAAKTLSTGGRVLAEEKALCRFCPRLPTRPEKIRIRRFLRMHETIWDEGKCFLPQGLLCLGPATRGGCGARCIMANMPCRGCFGPLENTADQGAAVLAFVAAMMDGDEKEALSAVADGIADPAGLAWRYSAAAALFSK